MISDILEDSLEICCDGEVLSAYRDADVFDALPKFRAGWRYRPIPRGLPKQVEVVLLVEPDPYLQLKVPFPCKS